MSYQNIMVEHRAPALWITLNRPKVNALSHDLIKELGQAVNEAKADRAVRCIVITGGTGKFFAAGADIPSIQATRQNPMAEGTSLPDGVRIFGEIEACEKPVIALVNGVALGGGCELSMACHIRIAADSAIFGQPEINLGIIPGWGGTFRLPRLVGESRAREWLMTGRNVSAQEALQAGLVSKIVPAEELAAAGEELVKVLASKAPIAMAQTLRALHENSLYPERGAEIEAAAFTITSRSNDAGEGISAFLEKRAPNFTGE
jgi:enoyl-CoA hydratase/carnithine racemase